MNTKLARIIIGSTYHFDSDIPVNCPYCSAYVEPQAKEAKSLTFNDKLQLYIVTFHVNCCSKLFFTVYSRGANGTSADLLLTYPVAIVEKIPEILQNISPRFDNLFKQASTAESLGHIELAGSGYRNALEVLIKDYAIKELGEPEDEVSKKQLFDAIGAYVPSIAIGAADVVRLLGNDYTHYQRKYDDIGFPTMKRYLHILIQALENDYLMKHPVVSATRS